MLTQTLKKIIIRNFQSHRKTILNLHPGINLIVGISNGGKSGIRRALELLFDNRPKGGRFLSNFLGKSGTTKVKTIWEDGIIAEIRKKIQTDSSGNKKITKQQYILNTEEKPLEGFGQKVPDVISEAINLDELNIQTQLESPFVISSSSTKIAKIINEITGLERVDDWQTKLSSGLSSTRKDLKSNKQNLKSNQEKLNKLSSLPQIKADIKKYKLLKRKSDDLTNSIEDLKLLSSKLTTRKKSIKKLESTISVLNSYRKQAEKLEPELLSDSILLLKKFIKISTDLLNSKKRLTKNIYIYKMKLKKEGICPLCSSAIKTIDQIRI